eukprot:3763424-Amphidinium_carterae.1
MLYGSPKHAHGSNNELARGWGERGRITIPCAERCDLRSESVVRHAPVETGARAVARMMSIATKVLDDPAGPSQRLALNAIRAHLLAEDDQIARALEVMPLEQSFITVPPA